MSFKSALIALIMFFGAIGVAYFLQVTFEGEVYSTRIPASDEDIHLKGLKKSEVLRPQNSYHPVHTEKLKGPLKISLSNPSLEKSERQNPQEVFTLNLTLRSEESLSLVKIKWSLPDGVRLISGQIEESLSLAAGEEVHRQIHLQSVSPTNQQVHVQVSSQAGPASFAEVAQYNTVFEEFLNPSKSQALQKSGSDSPADIQYKVFQ